MGNLVHITSCNVLRFLTQNMCSAANKYSLFSLMQIVLPERYMLCGFSQRQDSLYVNRYNILENYLFVLLKYNKVVNIVSHLFSLENHVADFSPLIIDFSPPAFTSRRIIPASCRQQMEESLFRDSTQLTLCISYG